MQEDNMATTGEKHEHALTQRALDTLAKWGKDPNIDGGENIAFSLTREGAPSDAFIGLGDCTPFTASGKRGVLHGQAPGLTGAPIAYFVIPAFVQVPFTFSFDLNKGKVSLNGAFPNIPPSGIYIVIPFDRADSPRGVWVVNKFTGSQCWYEDIWDASCPAGVRITTSRPGS
jgi:hypothetical protein